MSNFANSAQKYSKIVTQKDKEFQEMHNTVFSKLRCFLRHFDVVFHMFMVIKKTFNRYQNCCLDKIGKGNVVSDLVISPQKYPKIGKKEKEKCQGICHTVFQNYVVF